jgi:hypothetical protein
VTTVGQITATVWNTWTLPKPRRRQLRVLLVEIASLPADTRARMQAHRTRAAPRASQASYSVREFTDIPATAGRTVRAGARRIETSSACLGALAGRRHTARLPGLVVGVAARPRSHTGELRRDTVATTGARHFSKPVQRLLGPGGAPDALFKLYPTYEEMGAAAVLLICHEGRNLSVLQTMRVPDQWPNADAAAPGIHRVDTDKPRKGPRRRHGSNNLVDLGRTPQAGRSSRSWL